MSSTGLERKIVPIAVRQYFLVQFFFFLLKTVHFWKSYGFLHEQKMKEKLSGNHGQNISKFFMF